MRIDRCDGCGEHVDIASDHKPGCTRNALRGMTMAEVIQSSSGKVDSLSGRVVYLDGRDVKRIAAALSAAGFGLVADAGAKALEDAADAIDADPYDDLDPFYVGWLKDRAEKIREGE